jgi:hypothetical protein
VLTDSTQRNIFNYKKEKTSFFVIRIDRLISRIGIGTEIGIGIGIGIGTGTGTGTGTGFVSGQV